MKLKLITIISLIAICLAAFSARAAVVWQDNFDSYSNGLLPTNSTETLGGWFKFGGNASGVPVSGGQLYLGQTFSDDVAAPLTNGGYTATTGTNVLYASFTINAQKIPTGSGGFYFAFFKDAGTGNFFKGRILAFTNGVANASTLNTFRLGIANAASTASATNTTDLSVGTTYTVVERIVLPVGTAGNSVSLASTVWVVSDTTGLTESSASITATDPTTAFTLNDFAFRQPGTATSVSTATATFVIDNLIVGTTFADVVPSSVNPPIKLIEPADTNTLAGVTVNFTTLAVGDAPLSYQWFSNSPVGPVVSGTNATLWLTNVTVDQQGGYWAAITNAAGSNYTRTAILGVTTVPIPPTITNQPVSITTNLGATVAFTVVAGGEPPPAYQWYIVTNNITNILSGKTSTTLTLSGVRYSDQGDYFVTITNNTPWYTTNSAKATLTVTAPPLLNIAYLRSTEDTTTWAPTNTTTLFRAQGRVTTWEPMTTAGNTSFYIQDESAGINVFWSGAPSDTNQPPAGALVEVVAPLANFNGLLELSPFFTNANNSVTVISTGNGLPTPQALPFDPSTISDPSTMEMLEGSYFVATNVFLDMSSGIFASVSAGEQITNLDGQTFTMFINASTDIPGSPKPAGPVTIYGVLGQFTKVSPFVAGYQLVPSQIADIVGSVKFTNVLSSLTRAGDLPTNTFPESVLRPGEKLTMDIVAIDPAGGTVTAEPLTYNLSGNSSWTTTGPSSGLSVANRFQFQPQAGDAGSNYAVGLRLTTDSYGTFTNVWNVYVPTVAEQQMYIAEIYANPTSDTNSPSFNPLHRDFDTNNVAINDEYVEIVNLSSSGVQLLNWNLWDGLQKRHQFYAPTTLTSSNSFIIYGGPLNPVDGTGPNLPVASEPASESTSGLALNNTGTETISLHNRLGYLVDRVFYYETNLSSLGSISRFPTVTNCFVPQSYISTNMATPGLQYDGGAWNLPTKVPAGVTNIVIIKGNPLQLTFTADTNLASTLWQADSITSKFKVVNGTQFSNTAAAFFLTNPPANYQFYFMTTQ